MDPDNPNIPEPTRRSREIHVDMMRSIITEPLLSNISQADPNQKFDVIISLNETYREGIDGAMAWVKKRADEWKVRYSTVSHYVFACLTAQQLLALAEETRELMKVDRRTASVVYRIWEDTEIGTTL